MPHDHISDDSPNGPENEGQDEEELTQQRHDLAVANDAGEDPAPHIRDAPDPRDD